MVARCPPPASSTSVTLVSPIDLPEPSSTVPRSPPRYDWLHDAAANSAAQKIVFAVIYTSPPEGICFFVGQALPPANPIRTKAWQADPEGTPPAPPNLPVNPELATPAASSARRYTS